MKIALIILFALPIAYLIYQIIIYFFCKVPYVQTPKQYLDELFKNLNIDNKTVIYDLGCGSGRILFAAEKYKPAKLVGADISPLHILLAKAKTKLKNSKAEFRNVNFFKMDISEADIIYLFLVNKLVQKTWAKIKKEGKKGVKVVVLGEVILDKKAVMKIPTNPKNPNTTYFYIYII